MAVATAPLVVTAGPVTVTLDAQDAIVFAQQVRTLVRERRPPAGVADLMSRVASQILAATLAQGAK
jgi:hypothetical protein